jgi:hypothetical protein
VTLTWINEIPNGETNSRVKLIESTCTPSCRKILNSKVWITASNGTYGVSVMLRPGCRFFAASISGEVTSFPVLAQKNHCLIQSITARKAGIIKVSYTTDKRDERLPVFANTPTQLYQNQAQKQNITLFTSRSYDPELITKQIMVQLLVPYRCNRRGL